MRVRFSPEVVNEPTAWGCLDRIVFFFADQRHLWDIDDPDMLKESAWLQSDPGSRTSQRNLETLEKAFTRSIYPDQFVNSHSLRLIVDLHSCSEHKLSPADARRCLDAPVYVVVENAESDGAFLDAVIYALKRRVLLDAQTEGWWIFSHAGGAGEIPKEIERIRAKTTGPFRVFALADGDRLYPGQRT